MRYVLKFGGSSLSSSDKIKKVAAYIKSLKIRSNTDLIIVVSAIGKTTNKLINLANSLSSSSLSTEYSKLITLGENISACSLALALDEINVKSISLSANDVKIHAKGTTINAIITHIDKTKIEQLLKENNVLIITGFQGVNECNQTLALGRGGSDTTATALGILLNANVKIFTDVKGFYNADPNKFPKAIQKKSINIYSAIELANSGAKVLDSRCLELANKSKLNIEVLKSLSTRGTKLTYDKDLESFIIDGVSYKTQLSYVNYSYKTLDFLQNIKQNPIYKSFFIDYSRNKTDKNCTFISNMSPSTLSSFILKNKKVIINPCEMITITGSGFVFFKDFIEKLQNIIKNNHIYTFKQTISPTSVKIFTKQKQGEKLTQLILDEFNLLK